MNNKVEKSSDHQVQVFRVVEGSEMAVENGSFYAKGERLIARISPITDEYIIELQNGKFTRGGCVGKRSTKGGVFAVTALEDKDVVKIKAGKQSIYVYKAI